MDQRQVATPPGSSAVQGHRCQDVGDHSSGPGRSPQGLDRRSRRTRRRKRNATKSSFLASRDDHGRVVDFHSLRNTFITNLSLSGVQPKAAQTLARHSDINLTMNTYTMLRVLDQAAAVEALPPVPEAKGRKAGGRGRKRGKDAGTGAAESGSDRAAVVRRRCSDPGRLGSDPGGCAGEAVGEWADDGATIGRSRTAPPRFRSHGRPSPGLFCRRIHGSSLSVLLNDGSGT